MVRLLALAGFSALALGMQAPAGMAQTSLIAPCEADISGIVDDQPIWRGTVSLTCDESGQNGQDVIVGQPFLIGLTLFSYSKNEWGEETDWDKGETDFPVQIVTIDPASLTASVEFRIPRQQIGRVNQAQIGAWPIDAVAPCSSNRDGCEKYGYALGDFGWFGYSCAENTEDTCTNAVYWVAELKKPVAEAPDDTDTPDEEVQP
ncbi:MAG: hypothetical protein RLN72_13345 [Henriciella sp.]